MCSNSDKNSLYCKVYYLFDTIHFFFLLRKKTAITNIPTKPKITGKMSASQFPSSKTAAITMKNIPANNTIFWSIRLHILISSQTFFRFSLERLYLNPLRGEFVFNSKIKFSLEIKILFFAIPISTSIAQKTDQ